MKPPLTSSGFDLLESQSAILCIVSHLRGKERYANFMNLVDQVFYALPVLT